MEAALAIGKLAKSGNFGMTINLLATRLRFAELGRLFEQIKGRPLFIVGQVIRPDTEGEPASSNPLQASTRSMQEVP